jgi:hypothetical protein
MTLIYFSPIAWQKPAQRPHKFVEWFYSKYRRQVLWIDPYPTRFPLRKDMRRLLHYSYFKPKQEFNPDTPPWLTVLHPFALPCEPLPGSFFLNGSFWKGILDTICCLCKKEKGIIGIGKPSKLALEVLKRFPEQFSFYDAMDNFPAFYSGISERSQSTTEDELLSRVSRLVVSSTGLVQHLSAHQEKMSQVFNGFDPAVFPEPDLFSASCSAPPILGYLGTIDSWFDWDFVLETAIRNPGLIVRIVGPVYHRGPRRSMPSNIQFFPACSHKDAYRFMSEFTVGLIPFIRSQLTQCVDPIKYYEYRCLGIPVVSTKFGQMTFRAREDGVFLVDDAGDLQRQLPAVLAHRARPDVIRDFRNTHCWDARFKSFPLNMETTD